MVQLPDPLEEMFLPRVEQPNRYLGPLSCALRLAEGAPRVLLASPRVFGAALSLPGFQRLHAGLVGAGATVDLVFPPAADFESLLLEHRRRLGSLSLRLPCSDFPILFVWLERESDALGLIPLFQILGLPVVPAERGESDPVVVAGGPGFASLGWMCDVADVCLTGRAECAGPLVVEWAARRGESSREAAVARMREVRPTAQDWPFSPEPWIPMAELAETRLQIPLFQASQDLPGALSPLGNCMRPRPMERILQESLVGLEASGMDEIRLIQPADQSHPELRPILQELGRALLGRPVGLLLNGLPPGCVQAADLEVLSRHRRGPLLLTTLAASHRLRAAVGVPWDTATVLGVARAARDHGWNSLRLQLWLGLPGETSEDLEELIALVRQLQSPARAADAGSFQVSVAPEVWVPRPGCAMGADGVPPAAQLEASLVFLRRRLSRGQVHLRRGELERSLVDRDLAARGRGSLAVLRAASEAGLRMRTLEDPVSLTLWQQVGCPPETATGTDSIGPMLEPCAEVVRPGEPALDPTGSGGPGVLFGRRPRRPQKPGWQRGLRFRLHYQKGEQARFSSHLELMRSLERSLRRAALPLAYTGGQHPHPKISSGPPLALGFTSEAEYLDVEFTRSVDEGAFEALNSSLDPGVCIRESVVLPARPTSLSASIQLAAWRVWMGPALMASVALDPAAVQGRWRAGLQSLREADQPVLWPTRLNPDAKRVDARSLARGVEVSSGDFPGLHFETPVTGGIRPEMFAARLLGLDLDPRCMRVERTAQWVLRGTRRLTPLFALQAHSATMAAASDWA